MRTRFLLSILCVCGALGAFAQGAPPEAPPEAAPAPAAPTAESYAAQLDTLWKTRDAAATVKETDSVISDSLKTFGNDYGLLWRASRFRWWQADGTTNEKLRKQLAKEGWNYGERAIKARSDGAEGKYYTAISIGAYSQAVGILTALGEGLEGKFNENLDYAIKTNPAFDLYGPLVSKGRYYFELPWPKRDLEKSKAELGKALKGKPGHLRALYFLAETQLKDGQKKEAKASIDAALAGSGDYDPPEARRVKAWAKPLAEKIAAELK